MMNKNKMPLSYDIGKLPPQSVELEEMIIGALMLEKEAMEQVANILIPESFYKKLINNNPVKIIQNHTHELLQHAHAALVTSGTATLETALIGIPEVVCYKGNRISYEIAKRIVDIKYISLVNLIMDEEVVTELIQQELNKQNLKRELERILAGDGRAKMLYSFSQLKEKLGSGGASERAAEIISLSPHK